MLNQGFPRRYVLRGGAACMACAIAAPAFAATEAAGSLPPLIGPGYRPVDTDEKGLWMQVDEQERKLKASSFVIEDPALNGYVRGLVDKLAGDFAPDIRVYVLRVPYFNASMAPNGMLQLWSGLLLRVRNEAQLCAVLAHEIGHYQRKHSLAAWRSVRSKTAWMTALAFIPYGGGLIAQMALLGSLFSFSRDNEREADRIGLEALARLGYDPLEASRIWKSALDERNAAASARGKKAKADGGFFATHPSSAERLAELEALAKAQPKPEAGYYQDLAAFNQALQPHLVDFVDDQIKLNDFGGSKYLIEQLASTGWTPLLRYALGELYRQRNEQGDLQQAISAYKESMAFDTYPPEAQRGLGYALLKSGDTEGGKTHLRSYLEMRPNAPDAAIIATNL